ncbi:MAG: helix-turn-helix domain-containing protein [Actinomycetota bacterium]|nr:helix-turn-helix domain-containing protein [Actinomycetota bacterium]
MKNYGQYCPISKAAEVLGERWSLLVLREMMIGSRRFNDIARGLPGMSRSLLSKRLRSLEGAGIVERLDGDYQLTPAGQDLRAVVFGLGEWGTKWLLEEPLLEECDVEVIMWWGHARLNTEPLPDRRVVLEFVFADDRRRVWVVVESVGCSVCLHDPGFGVDAIVTTDSRTLYQVWMGLMTPAAALRSGSMAFDGPPAITRRLPEVLAIAPADSLGADAAAPRPRLYEAPPVAPEQ